MRRQTHLQFPTKDERGSITLEAALVMPVLFLLLLFFYILLMIASAQMALQATASATVQQISSNIHPIALAVGKISENHTQMNSDSSSIEENSIKSALYEVSEYFPSPINQLIQESLIGNWWPAINLASTTIGKELLESFIRTNADYPILEKDRVELVYLQLPDLLNGTDQNVILTLEYKLPLKIPFLNQSIMIREQAMQRAWLPDTKPANYEITEDEQFFIDIISLTPNPVRPGRKATLKIVTTPNTMVDLSILYKSGQSTAKNLGVITSNENGEAEWTWHVSGNTTEGEWLLKLSLPESSYELEQTFQVMKNK